MQHIGIIKKTKFFVKIANKLSAPKLSAGLYKNICSLTKFYRRIFPELYSNV